MGDDSHGTGYGDDLDNRVGTVLAAGGTPEQVASTLAASRDVVAAQVRPGLVKTEPPIVELVVERRDEHGEVRSRVYDLTLHPDGRLDLAGAHDEPSV